MIEKYYSPEDVRTSTQICLTYAQDLVNFAPSDKGIRFASRLPFDVKYEVFKRLPLPFAALCIKEDSLRYTKIFEMACRNNNIHPANLQDIDWCREFSSVWLNFKTRRYHKEPDWTWTCYMDTKIDMEITGRKLYVLEDYRQPTKHIQALKINMELRQSKNPPGGNRKTHVLDQTYELQGSTLHCNFTLGNPHDLAYSGQKAIVSRLTFEGSANVTKLAFDNEDRVYYYRAIGTKTHFYRKTFGTSDKPEFLLPLRSHITIMDLSVGNDKLFITYHHPDTQQPRFVMCMDLKIGYASVVETWSLDPNYNLVAHNNCFVYSDVQGHTMIYKFSENCMTPYEVRSKRRQVLNRNTYIVLDKTSYAVAGMPDYMLKTITILDEGPIVQFVQFCEKDCVFRRLGDNFFYVLERHRRQLWYQDEIGSRPIRLTGDAIRTTIVPNPRGYKFFSPVES